MFDGKKEIVSACTYVSDEVSETFVLKLLEGKGKAKEGNCRKEQWSYLLGSGNKELQHLGSKRLTEVLKIQSW